MKSSTSLSLETLITKKTLMMKTELSQTSENSYLDDCLERHSSNLFSLNSIREAIPESYGEFDDKTHSLIFQFANLRSILRAYSTVQTNSEGGRVEFNDIEQIISDQLDDHAQNLHKLYEATRNLPHPYDALHDVSKGLLHDFIGTAFSVKRTFGIS